MLRANPIIISLSVDNAKVQMVCISAMFVKMSADIIKCHIANVMNKDISDKTANLRPIF